MTARDVLLEIGTEEMPASAVDIGIAQLGERAQELLSINRLSYQGLDVVGTPRRLALLVSGLEERQAETVHEVKGPARKVAYDEGGQPTKAAKGFAASQGVKVSELVATSTEQGEYVFAIKTEIGRETRTLLPALLSQTVLSLNFPKSMRWGDSEIRFVRPIRWIVALFGAEIVHFSLDGIDSGNLTWGHRFLGVNPVKVAAPRQYRTALERQKVVVDHRQRAESIRRQIEEAASAIDGRVVINTETFEEAVHLVEYPHAVLGTFSELFISLPRDVLVTAMESHQRYFPVEARNGRLLPHFVVVHNGDPGRADLIRRGHERVLRARLADARFFYDEDLKEPLSEKVDDLEGVVFQERLGTVRQKIERVRCLSARIAERLGLAKEQRQNIDRAALLSKADLVTEMVVEFPSLQGAMGREYARVAKEPEEVALGIFEHYLPKGAAGPLPETAAGKIVSVADKLDSVAGCLAIGLVPTGSEDPYALRRQTSGAIAIAVANEWALSLWDLVNLALDLYQEQGVRFDCGEAETALAEFLQGRVRAFLIGRGIPADVIEAVLPGEPEGLADLASLVDRAVVLTAQAKTAGMEDLAVAFTRCKNLGSPDLGTDVDPSLFAEPAESVLYESVAKAREELEAALEARDFREAVAILSRLRKPVDRFFDDVLVMAEDKAVRENRLRLLNLVVEVFLKVADFSKLAVASTRSS